MSEIIIEHYQNGMGPIKMTGAIYNYNWHKHPEGLFHPSSMDLNSPDAASSCFHDSPDMQVFTWAIAT